MTPGDTNHPSNFVTVDTEDHKRLTELANELADVLLSLDSTTETITYLHKIPVYLCRYGEAESEHELYESLTANSHMTDLAFDKATGQVQYLRKKTEALLSKVQNTRELVRRTFHRTDSAFTDRRF